MFISNILSINTHASDIDLQINKYSDEYLFLEGLLIPNSLLREIKRLSPKRVLFLSDKESKNSDHDSLAQAIAPLFSDHDIEFFKTDFECKYLGYIKI